MLHLGASLRQTFGSAVFLLLIGSSFAQSDPGAAQRAEAYTMRIDQWDAKAQLVRRVKTKEKEKRRVEVVKGVKTGTRLQVSDAITTDKKEVSVFAGAVGIQWITPNSAVRYVAFAPPALDPTKKSTVELEIDRGEVFHRTGPVAADSVYRSRSGARFAASAGTAYAVAARGSELEVLVAEGEVKVGLSNRPGQTLTVGPRQKVQFGNTLPAAPTPIGPSDEGRIRRLLSLPISSIVGYGDPAVLTREDAEEIVTLQVRPKLKVERAAEKEAKWQPMSVVVPNDRTFWTVDAAGRRRESGNGLRFLAASPNGEGILGVDADKNLVTVDLQGRRWEAATDLQEFYSLSPDGLRAVVKLERWITSFKEVTPGLAPERSMKRDKGNYLISTRGGMESSIVYLSGGGKANDRYVWRMGSDRLFIVQESAEFSAVTIPTNRIGDNIVTLGRMNRETPFSQRGEWRITIPPSGHWVVAQNAEKMVIADANHGTSIEILLGREVREYSDGRTLRITLADGSYRFVTRSLKDFNPLNFGQLGADLTPQIAASLEGSGFLLDDTYALSPNGELVTFRSPGTETVLVADSLDLTRDSDTYVGYPTPYRCEWVSGDEVLYEKPNREDGILIRLGVKRERAVPRGFLGFRPPAESPGFSMPVGTPYSEVILSDINDRGEAVGFTKIDLSSPTGSFRVNPFRSNRPEMIGTTVLLAIADDGTAFGWNEAYLANGRKVAIPPNSGDLLNPDNATTSDGQAILEGNRIWDPKAKGGQFPVGEGQPYGGKVRPLRNVPPGAMVHSINRKGQVLYVSDPQDPAGSGDGPRSMWIGKLDEKPVQFEAKWEHGIDALGEDGNVYLTYRSDNGNGTPMVSRLYRVRPTGQPEKLYEGQPWANPIGALPDGTVYGVVLVDIPGRRGLMTGGWSFAIYRGEFIPLDPLLGPTYKMAIRKINNRGDIAGSILRSGKPVAMVPNLYTLLRQRQLRK